MGHLLQSRPAGSPPLLLLLLLVVVQVLLVMLLLGVGTTRTQRTAVTAARRERVTL
jgi:hypothetical protein